MIINDLLEKEKMTRYRLSKESGVPMTTISDICSGKADLEQCSAGTLYKIAKILGVTVDSLLEGEKTEVVDYCCTFNTFKSNTCHRVKDKGDLDFIIETLEADEIRKLYDKQWRREALYLLAMVDYLSRMNGLPMCKDYNDIRSLKLEKPCFPSDVILNCAVSHNDSAKEKAIANAIPEFMRFNIVEGDIRNVC